MINPDSLRPARRNQPDPEGGWRGADLKPDELVDDEFIADDPSSYVVDPDGEPV